MPPKQPSTPKPAGPPKAGVPKQQSVAKRPTPNSIKRALGCSVAAFAFFIMAFTTTSWTSVHSKGLHNSFGLWHYLNCSCVTDSCTTKKHGSTNGYHITIQVMECLALIAFSSTMVLLVLYMLFSDNDKRRITLDIAIASIFVGLLFSNIGLGMFSNTDSSWNVYAGYYGWSMTIHHAASTVYGITGLILIYVRVNSHS